MGARVWVAKKSQAGEKHNRSSTDRLVAWLPEGASLYLITDRMREAEREGWPHTHCWVSTAKWREAQQL